MEFHSRFSKATHISGADVTLSRQPLEIPQGKKKGNERSKGVSKKKNK
jgi:hypothetical protein